MGTPRRAGRNVSSKAQNCGHQQGGPVPRVPSSPRGLRFQCLEPMSLRVVSKAWLWRIDLDNGTLGSNTLGHHPKVDGDGGGEC